MKKSLVILLFMLIPGTAYSYTLSAAWPTRTATFDQKGFTGSNAVFDAAFGQALNLWNTTSAFSFIATNKASDPCSGIRNGWGFTTTLCGGVAYGTGLVAVTMRNAGSYGTLAGARIVFNAAYAWDVHTGAGNGVNVDFRRVALHELGHALGLGHDNTFVAVMNTKITTVEVPQADDINGAVALYGSRVTPPDDHGNTMATSTMVGSNSTTVGSLERVGDLDYFKIILTYPGILTLTSNALTADVKGRLLNSSGIVVSSNDNTPCHRWICVPDKNFTITQPLTAGTYYVEVSGGQLGRQFGSYQLVSTFVRGPPGTPNDFNGDGKSDILFHQAPTGKNFMMLMNGKKSLYTGFVKRLATSWRVAGTGDYNGDGKRDILFHQASTGRNFMMFMNGKNSLGMGFVKRLAASWRVAGTGDFNGDGKSDILFHQTSTGKNFMMLMNGKKSLGMGFVKRLATSWTIAGTGDYNGDGKSDILFHQASTGKNFMILMNGKKSLGMGFVKRLAASWNVAGTGDFNGDGKSDILFHQASTGKNFMMLLNGKKLLGMGFVKHFSASWRVAGTGDYNGDGKSDILFHQASTGKNFMILMNGKKPLGMGIVKRLATSWSIVNM